ncbi:MAG: D-amino-acid transaminase [Candidatus Poribacteria bacterium]|nr:MAG: D-amino-acid transaminase [Candidatus Poribacteria bacterium]
MEQHLRRLHRSMRELWIERMPIGQVEAAVYETYAASEIPNAVVYFQVTRGVSARDYDFTPDLQPTLIVTARILEPAPSEYAEQGVSAITYPEIRWGRVDIKSLNLLANMMAKKEAKERGAYEALFVTPQGWMTEGASTSLFIVQSGRLITRELGTHILPGITRELVLECAREAGFAVEERPFTREELLNAEEVFITGTTFGVYGVVRVDGRPIGEGVPGERTRQLRALYLDRVAKNDDAPRS